MEIDYAMLGVEKREVDFSRRYLLHPSDAVLLGVDVASGKRAKISMHLYNDILAGRQAMGLNDYSGYTENGLPLDQMREEAAKGGPTLPPFETENLL